MGLSEKKESPAGLVRVPLFWKSHCSLVVSLFRSFVQFFVRLFHGSSFVNLSIRSCSAVAI